VAQQPNLALGWLHLGQLLETQNQRLEAENCFSQAVIQVGSNLPAILELGGFFQRRAQYDQAARLYLRAIECEPGNAQFQLAAAQNLAAEKKSAEALQHSERAVALAPDFAPAHLLLGTLLGRQGELARAREEFRLALQFDPDLIDARVNLGIALMRENPVAALAQFKEVLKRDPNHSSALKLANQLEHQFNPP